MDEILTNELNKFEVVESRCGGGELEYVLIKDTKEHREQLNYLLCVVNTWAYVTERFSPAMYEFLDFCKSECEGYLDLAHLISNSIQNVDLEKIGFNQKSNQWELVGE